MHEEAKIASEPTVTFSKIAIAVVPIVTFIKIDQLFETVHRAHLFHSEAKKHTSQHAFP